MNERNHTVKGTADGVRPRTRQQRSHRVVQRGIQLSLCHSSVFSLSELTYVYNFTISSYSLNSTIGHSSYMWIVLESPIACYSRVLKYFFIMCIVSFLIFAITQLSDTKLVFVVFSFSLFDQGFDVKMIKFSSYLTI